MAWTAQVKKMSGQAGVRARLRRDGKVASFGTVAKAWRDDPGARRVTQDLVAGVPFEACFFETPPLTSQTATQPFECVLLDAPALAGVRPDSGAFASWFRGAEDVAVFDNLGGDARLIAPCPRRADDPFSHFAAFTRSAEASQADALFSAIGREVLARVSAAPIWVSTSGLGVPWLHVRIDSTPKYYQFAPYRSAP